MRWHVLDANSIWIREFSAALQSTVSERVLAWSPKMQWTGAFRNQVATEQMQDPPLKLIRFPLQRGYARFPFSALVKLGPMMCKRLTLHSADAAAASTLICTTPYYAPVALCWPGPVVYYQTDLTVAYAGADPALVRRLDRSLCRVAHLVCPNSTRIADYFLENGCDPEKITVVPNATRAANLLPSPAFQAAPLPPDAADLPRPIAGVIGNLAANIDWIFLRDLIARTPEFSWLMVGPYSMEVPDAQHHKAREQVLALGGRVRFLGSRPYGALQSYARGLDVAVLPYRKKEPTFSGSSTRFYEHLAAGRPMISTRGFEELLHKEPLLALSDNPEEAAVILERWKTAQFQDGHETDRWEASRSGTWEVRAAAMVEALRTRLPRSMARSREGRLDFAQRRTA